MVGADGLKLFEIQFSVFDFASVGDLGKGMGSVVREHLSAKVFFPFFAYCVNRT
jgi:hypothetical protein